MDTTNIQAPLDGLTRHDLQINRREVMYAKLGAPILAIVATAAVSGISRASERSTPAGQDAANAALLDRYMAAVNAHDLSSFPNLFSEDYIQHSGRTPSGLKAQIANFQRILETWPDFRWEVDDRIISGDKIVARTTISATHSRVVLGFAPTGRRVAFGTIDIWRVADGKFAEHWDLVDTAGREKQLRGD